MAKLKGRRVVLTGASAGLGLALAKAFHTEGADLLLVARRGDQLEEVKKALSGDALVGTCVMDVADPAAPDVLFSGPWAETDVLVNNAAVQGPVGPLWEVDWQAWQVCLAVDLAAPIALSRAAIPGMIRRGGGKIISLSGGGATGPRAMFSAYATAKAALVRFSECLAQEVQAHKIDVNCVAPGAMPTAMLQGLMNLGAERVGRREYDAALRARETGQKVIDQAVACCVYLASAESDGITGKLISAVWDPWSELQSHAQDLKTTDIYTLRRIVPKDRGKDWGE
jgi:3-oxoacyl-[acyl-carrier protein] reductase